MLYVNVSECDIRIECEPETIPYRGNCSAVDDDSDREAEEWIERQLARGNDWAWCTIKVTATWRTFEGTSYLGCCSYHSRRDFERCDDGAQIAEAVADLNLQIARAAAQ